MRRLPGYITQAVTVTALGTIVSMAGLSGAAATERVIVAVNPPSTETFDLEGRNRVAGAAFVTPNSVSHWHLIQAAN
jgi:hypothetical protein